MEITVDQIFEGRSVEYFLKTHMYLSRGLLRRIKKNGWVCLNGSQVLMKHKLKTGDIIKLHLEEEKSNILPQPIPLVIVYEDDHILVADKPCSMLVHPLTCEPGGTLANAVMFHWHKSNSDAKVFRPLYRIDRDTSGLVLISKNQFTYSKLLRQLLEKTIQRVYLAVVEGFMDEEKGVIELPIARKAGSLIKREVSPAGREARTRYTVLKRLSKIEASLLAVEIETGRTHQIRVHLSHIGHPLLGDEIYGGRRELIGRQALHVHSMSFIHPVDGNRIVLTSPIPADVMGLM